MAKKQSGGSKRTAKAAGAKGRVKAGKARAKPRARAAKGDGLAMADAAAAATDHVSNGYALKMANSNEACRFDLEVNGGDYFLRVSDPSDRPALVKKALATMGKYWPDYNWPFKADPNGNIVDIG